MANKHVNRWVLIFCTSKSSARKLIRQRQEPSARKLIKPRQELSDYAWNMQSPARAVRPSHYSCLPLRLSSSPAAAYNSSTDEGEYDADEEVEETMSMSREQLARSYSCSKLQAKLVPASFKSLLMRRASSHSSVHNRNSQSCTLNDFAAEGGSSPNIKQKRAPKGHVAVYVEAGRERHVVPIAYLSHPHFRALLERAEREFGLRQKGPGLRIPCSLSELHHTLHQIRTQ